MKDTQKELNWLEQELLAEEPQGEENAKTDEELLEEIMEELAEPAGVQLPGVKEAYSNYVNEYGEDLEALAQTGETEPKKKGNDKLLIGLMITASLLCAGIIGILVYWLRVLLL